MPKRERPGTSSRSDSPLFSRRDFVTRTSLIGAGLVVGTSLWRGCSDQSADVRTTTGTGSARGSNKMKTRQLGTLQVSEIGAGASSRQCPDRDEVWLRHRGRHWWSEQPPRAYQGSRRRLAQAPPHRPYRSAVPASRRPERPDRGRCGRGQRADRSGQGSALRPL